MVHWLCLLYINCLPQPPCPAYLETEPRAHKPGIARQTPDQAGTQDRKHAYHANHHYHQPLQLPQMFRVALLPGHVYSLGFSAVVDELYDVPAHQSHLCPEVGADVGDLVWYPSPAPCHYQYHVCHQEQHRGYCCHGDLAGVKAVGCCRPHEDVDWEVDKKQQDGGGDVAAEVPHIHFIVLLSLVWGVLYTVCSL